MTKYFAGNSLAAFSRNSTGVVDVTTSGRFDSAYVGGAIYCPTSSEYFESPPFSASSGSFWLRFDARLETVTSGSTSFVTILNAFRVQRNGSIPAFECSYWNGSSWVASGSSFSFSFATLHTFVIRLDLGTGFELFIDGVSVATGTLSASSVSAVRFFGSNTINAVHYSQIMAADYDIRDAHFMTSAINGNSATNTGAASGVYTDVNELVLNDATAISVTTSGNKAGQTHAGVTLPGGMVIAAMVVNARGRHDSLISDGKLGVRSGGSNYSSSGKSFSGGYSPRGHIVENDPATGVKFTQSGFNAAEPYLEAA